MSKNLKVEVSLKVPFFDIDAMGVVWHGHYAKYFEIARGALMDKINYGYLEMNKSGYFWPIIDLRIKYVKSIRLEQDISINAELVEYENRLKIEYLISDAETGERLCKGYSCQVAVEQRTGEMCFQSPPVLYEKLGVSE